MSNEVAIAVERLSKRYRIGLEEEMHDTLFGAITSWIKSPLSNLKQLQKLTKFNDLPREIFILLNTALFTPLNFEGPFIWGGPPQEDSTGTW